MSRAQVTTLCCVLNPHGKCSACKLVLCRQCYLDHFQKNDMEIMLKFLDSSSGMTHAYYTRMKCSLSGKPAILAFIDTTLRL